jgi:hypothetical protein
LLPRHSFPSYRLARTTPSRVSHPDSTKGTADADAVIGCTAPRSLFHCRAASDLTLEMARRAPALVVPMSGLGCAFCSDDAPTRCRVALIGPVTGAEGVRVTPPSRPWLERGPSNLRPEGDPWRPAASLCTVSSTPQPSRRHRALTTLGVHVA